MAGGVCVRVLIRGMLSEAIGVEVEREIELGEIGCCVLRLVGCSWGALCLSWYWFPWRNRTIAWLLALIAAEILEVGCCVSGDVCGGAGDGWAGGYDLDFVFLDISHDEDRLARLLH